MRVKEGTLTPRQTELMEFLWEANEPMTANKMAEKLAPRLRPICEGALLSACRSLS